MTHRTALVIFLDELDTQLTEYLFDLRDSLNKPPTPESVIQDIRSHIKEFFNWSREHGNVKHSAVMRFEIESWKTTEPTEPGYYWACLDIGSVKNLCIILRIIIADGVAYNYQTQKVNYSAQPSRENFEHVHHWMRITEPELPDA